MVDVRHLRYFIAAVEEGSLLNAALRVNIAQPALSRRIRDMEQQLGCLLLERGRQGVTPTAAGQELYRRALRIVRDLDRACEITRHIGRANGRAIRFGILPSSRKYGFIHDTVARFRDEQADRPIAFVTEFSHRLDQMLGRGRLDLALVYGTDQRPPGVMRRVIHQERVILAAHPAHPLAAERPAALSELSNVPLIWLMLRGNGEFENGLKHHLQRHGVEMVTARTARSYDEVVDLTVATGGATLVIASTMDLMAPGALVYRPLPELTLRLGLCLDWNPAFADGENAVILDDLNGAIDAHQQRLRDGEVQGARLFGEDVIELPGD